MADLDPLAGQISDGIRRALTTFGSLALGLARLAAVIGVATFATGWWVFAGSHSAWIVVGGVLCFAPCAAALLGWHRVRATVKVAPALVGDVRKFVDGSREAASTLIIVDSDDKMRGIGRQAFGPIPVSLGERRGELPALWAGVRAVTTLPGLTLIAVTGMFGVGMLGTILLVAGLIK